MSSEEHKWKVNSFNYGFSTTLCFPITNSVMGGPYEEEIDRALAAKMVFLNLHTFFRSSF